MINQAMIDQLTAQLAVYTTEWLSSYDDSKDQNVLIGPSKKTAIIWTDTGFYQINPCPNKLFTNLEISFTDCTIGHTYSLTQNYDSMSWILYQQLYLAGVNSKSFYIDVPLERSEVTINNQPWEYTRVMRPGAPSIGKKNYVQTLEDLEGWWNQSIDDFYNVMSAAVTISKNNKITGLPSISVKHRLPDVSGICYFYKNCGPWDQSLVSLINQSINIGNSIIKSVPALGNTFSDTWTNNAKQKWNTLGQ